MENIVIETSDNFSLDTLFSQGNNEKGIIFCHGLGWYKEGEEPFVEAAKRLHEYGFSTILFAFRANGKSSGESTKDFTVSSQLADIASMQAFLENRAIKTICLAGASFGAGATALFAARHADAIKKLLLLNPTVEFESSIIKHYEPQLPLLEKQGYIEVHKEKYKLGKQLFEELKSLTPYKELENYKNDLLIVHGDADDRIPYQTVLSHFENLTNLNKEFVLIKGAGHGFHEEPFQSYATDIIVDFFLKS